MCRLLFWQISVTVAGKQWSNRLPLCVQLGQKCRLAGCEVMCKSTFLIEPPCFHSHKFVMMELSGYLNNHKFLCDICFVDNYLTDCEIRHRDYLQEAAIDNHDKSVEINI